MKILIVSTSDIEGGAARAAYRIHHAVRRNDVNSQMLVNQARSGDYTVTGRKTKTDRAIVKIRELLAILVTKRLKTKNQVLHSPAIVPSRLSKKLNTSDVDVVHLHWINGEMMSISDIGNITKPVIWTLHDMWAFCGAEHYTDDYRWRDGYFFENRPSYESGFDLNRWTANRKLKHWKSPIQIVTPSKWLADCAKQSVLMRNWPITVIPNAIDTDAWEPVDKTLARKILKLPEKAPLLLFGAMGGGQDPRKGFDLLRESLNHLVGQFPSLELVIFGEPAPRTQVDMGFPVHYTGHLNDDISLRLYYCAADAMVIPSRQDNLPNTGVEAHSCGTPVVAFNTCGLPDIVEHQKTGYLAKAFDPLDLARGLTWVLSDPVRRDLLGQAARERALRLWSYETIAAQYTECYKKISSEERLKLQTIKNEHT